MELSIEQQKIADSYYKDNAKKLYDVSDKVLRQFGWLSDKDYDNFYVIATDVFLEVIQKYDGKRSFDGFLYSCLDNKFKTEITRLNRQKRQADRNAISIDSAIGNTDNLTISDILQSDFNIDSKLEEKGIIQAENIEKYLSSLSKVQRQILEMKIQETPVSEIKDILKLTDKQYEQHCNEIKSYEKISILGIHNNSTNSQEESKMQITQTMEKSKPDKMSIASILKKMDKHTIRFDHPLQRESEQWSPSMKGNLISDILQGNPIPALVFAEQVVNGIAIIWDLDGKQRCTNAYNFSKDGYKITKNIRRWMIEYQAPVLDENGKTIMDENNFPKYERKEFDIRGKKFSDLPEELQDKFNDYNFEIVQYLNCSSEDIAYHIARYNEGKPMTAPQKGITRLGEEFASVVKSISSMPFFKDKGGYKGFEFRNGTVNRVVVESVMAANFLGDWKKKQEDMCEYIKDNAAITDFDNFEDMVGRLEKVVTDDVADMFNSKDSFLWFGLFARFIQAETDDKKFIEFMAEFTQSLHTKKINGISYDDLNGKSTKDKNVVLGKMDHLEKLMYEFLDVNKEDVLINDTLTFVKDNVSQDATQDDIELYEDCLNDLTLNVDNDTKLLNKQNHPSLVAIVAYACEKDIYMDEWFIDFFEQNKDYIRNQKDNLLHMIQSLEDYKNRTDKKSA